MKEWAISRVISDAVETLSASLRCCTKEAYLDAYFVCWETLTTDTAVRYGIWKKCQKETEASKSSQVRGLSSDEHPTC